jgi:hypothetical protein
MGCHQRKKKETLIRLVKRSDGTYSLDETRESEGRGYYLCPDQSCLKMVQKKIKGFGTMGLMDHGHHRSKVVPVDEGTSLEEERNGKN